jgi:hypothetical protein
MIQQWRFFNGLLNLKELEDKRLNYAWTRWDVKRWIIWISFNSTWALLWVVMLYCDQKKILIALMITLTWSPWNMNFFSNDDKKIIWRPLNPTSSTKWQNSRPSHPKNGFHNNDLKIKFRSFEFEYTFLMHISMI